jgi:hypothetical protein
MPHIIAQVVKWVVSVSKPEYRVVTHLASSLDRPATTKVVKPRYEQVSPRTAASQTSLFNAGRVIREPGLYPVGGDVLGVLMVIVRGLKPD